MFNTTQHTSHHSHHALNGFNELHGPEGLGATKHHKVPQTVNWQRCISCSFFLVHETLRSDVDTKASKSIPTLGGPFKKFEHRYSIKCSWFLLLFTSKQLPPFYEAPGYQPITNFIAWLHSFFLLHHLLSALRFCEGGKPSFPRCRAGQGLGGAGFKIFFLRRLRFFCSVPSLLLAVAKKKQLACLKIRASNLMIGSIEHSNI